MPTDSELRQAVIKALDREPSIVDIRIGVTALLGVIGLTCAAAGYMQRRAATMAASKVEGVTGVSLTFTDLLPFDDRPTDERIAAAAVARLRWDVSLPRNAIRVQVRDGWITLTGHANSYDQKETACQQVRSLPGVTGLSDHLTIT